MKNDKFLVGAPSLRAICDLSSVIGHRAAAVHGAPSVTVRFEGGSFAGLTAKKWNHRRTQSSPAATKNLAIFRVFVVDWARPLPRRREESGRVFDQSKNSFQLYSERSSYRRGREPPMHAD